MTSRQSKLKIRATFTGQNLSMGYITGKTYTGVMHGNMFYPDEKSARPCPYTVAGFLKNYSNIEVLYVIN